MTEDVKIYDFELDQMRPVTQKDVDDLTALVQKLGRVKQDMLKCMAAHFPTFAEDLVFADKERSRRARERLNG